MELIGRKLLIKISFFQTGTKKGQNALPIAKFSSTMTANAPYIGMKEHRTDVWTTKALS